MLVYGDSLSAAYGMPAQSGWAALLAARLQRERPDYSVANASISGETTAGGLARLQNVLDRLRPAVVILELGANDGLRGLPVAVMKNNLSALIALAQKAGARVLLIGVHMPPNYGEAYTKPFTQAYVELAKRHGIAMLPHLLEGFAANPESFQADRIHPTAAAQARILNNIWPVLAPLLK